MCFSYWQSETTEWKLANILYSELMGSFWTPTILPSGFHACYHFQQPCNSRKLARRKHNVCPPPLQLVWEAKVKIIDIIFPFGAVFIQIRGLNIFKVPGCMYPYVSCVHVSVIVKAGWMCTSFDQ